MDSEKAELLDAIDGPDPDEDDLIAAPRGAIRDRVRTQIVDDDPPQVWHTARRLTCCAAHLGYDRASALYRELGTGPGAGVHQQRWFTRARQP